ncbi:MCE family protein [Mycobacterium sp. CVI_P3]|uniref:MCE family protein n=1 Tax=Mycobacterium pinniadriaticum TaxID=2994102 RepID=A0ABT3SF64_9MYCO|nr:MCE family protein [Mycobacterium pinniadriaticum]MCX2931790.1 MCE family protein [Mycobacterium pinniadriaticum]MCX2938135.1 MCE family protein [Mycobacterium pinniadriaticum]
MRSRRRLRNGLRIGLALLLVGGAVVTCRVHDTNDKTRIVAYFDNSNGLFAGDEVRILGVPVGAIDAIEPQPEQVKITFWVHNRYKVPADAKAAIVSPQLVTSRAIQLTPAYTSGAVMPDGAIIPQTRTAVPLEWDDLRQQLEKLTTALQPTQPGGVSTLGAFINTSADNLRGQGANIRDTIIKMSQALSILGDHSNDIFSSIKNLSTVVSALQDSATLLKQLNVNMAVVTAAVDGTPDAVGNAVKDINDVVGDTTRFIADNRESIGTTTDKLASITTAVQQSIDDIEQSLHLFPNAFQNFVNIYQPTQQGLTGALVMNNFANPISFLCGGIQAASKLNAEQSAKLCVQYLAPIVKNRQYNFPPLGSNYVVGAGARPNEVTYSENWMRPDYTTPRSTSPTETPLTGAPLAAEAAPSTNPDTSALPPADSQSTDPSSGLPGMMVPQGGGS